MRTVVETENSVDDVFAYLLDTLGGRFTVKYYKSGALKKAAGVDCRLQLFNDMNADAGTRVEYREIGLPWYVLVWRVSHEF